MRSRSPTRKRQVKEPDPAHPAFHVAGRPAGHSDFPQSERQASSPSLSSEAKSRRPLREKLSPTNGLDMNYACGQSPRSSGAQPGPCVHPPPRALQPDHRKSCITSRKQEGRDPGVPRTVRLTAAVASRVSSTKTGTCWHVRLLWGDSAPGKTDGWAHTCWNPLQGQWDVSPTPLPV